MKSDGCWVEGERESEVVESYREREMEVQEVAEGVQGSIQPAGLGDERGLYCIMGVLGVSS